MGDKLGTLEPGKLADVIVIAGRPDENLQDLANVDMVIRDGEIVVRDGRVFIPRHQPTGRRVGADRWLTAKMVVNKKGKIIL